MIVNAKGLAGMESASFPSSAVPKSQGWQTECSLTMTIKHRIETKNLPVTIVREY